MQELRSAGPHGPPLKIMDSLYLRGLRASHPLTSDNWTGWAHWLRMPPHLLTTHLIRKAWFRWTGLDDQASIRIPESEEEKH